MFNCVGTIRPCPAQPGWLDNEYNHFNVLRTIEHNFGLSPVGDMDAKAKPITDIWE
jgi:hypothetical protein